MLMSIIFNCSVFILLTLPFTVHANVLINEVAWMGTTTSANAEWVELYNNAPDAVLLDGWSLAATDGSPSISLIGSIPGEGYALLERTNDDTLPEVTATVIYTGSLSNLGEHLQLKDNLGATMDDLDATAGWPGGDNVTKYTLQRNGSNWGTAVATPGGPWVEGDATTSGTVPPIPKTTPTEDPNSLEMIAVKPVPLYSARMVVPDFGTAGVAVPMTVIVKEDGKRDMVSGKFAWSMGDGSSYLFDQNVPVQHIFYYPGSYTVVLNYYSNNIKEEPDSIHKKVITIVPDAISIIDKTDDGGIIIKNSAAKEIALDQWMIVDRDKKFIFPKFTFIAKGQELAVSSKTIGFVTSDAVQIVNPSGVLVAHYVTPQETGGEEIVTSEEPEQALASPQGVTQEAVPEVASFSQIGKRNKIYIIAGIVVALAFLAYFAWRLYAERDEWL